MTPESTLARLAGLPEFNLERGLAAVLGKKETYLKFLGRLLASHGDDTTRVAQCLAAGNLEAAQRLAHTLSGTAATLGADGLSARAAALEALIKAGPHGVSSAALHSAMIAVGQELAALATALKGDPGQG